MKDKKFKDILHKCGFNISALDENKVKLNKDGTYTKDYTIHREQEEIEDYVYEADTWGASHSKNPKCDKYAFPDWDNYEEKPPEALLKLPHLRKAKPEGTSYRWIIEFEDSTPEEITALSKQMPAGFELLYHKKNIALRGGYGTGDLQYWHYKDSLTEWKFEEGKFPKTTIQKFKQLLGLETQTQSTKIDYEGYADGKIPEKGTRFKHYQGLTFKLAMEGKPHNEIYAICVKTARQCEFTDSRLNPLITSALKKYDEKTIKDTLFVRGLKLVKKLDEKELPEGQSKFDVLRSKLLSQDDLGMERYQTEQGEQELQSLIEWIIKHEAQEKNQITRVLTEALLEKFDIYFEPSSEDLFLWKGDHIDIDSVKNKNILNGTMEEYEQDLSPETVTNVIKKIQRQNKIFLDREQLNSKNGIGFNNGFYSFETEKLTPHNSENYNTSVIPMDYNPVELPEGEETTQITHKEGEETTERTVKELSAGQIKGIIGDTLYDQKLRECLSMQKGDTWVLDFEKYYTWYEFLGYSLFRDLKFDKGIFCYGRGQNGKGMFLEHWRGLLGEENCSSETTNDLTNNNFRTANLFGKVANIAPDVEYHELKRGSSKLKTLIRGERLTAERKKQHSFQFNNEAVIMVSGNIMPYSYDQSDGWFRSWILMEWTRQFLPGSNEFDADLEKKLKENTQDNQKILGFVVALGQKLNERGRFRFEQTPKENRKTWNERSDPLVLWQKERCTLGDEYELDKREGFADYEQWCFVYGLNPMKRKWFSRDMGLEFEEGFPKDGKRDTYRVFMGIRLKADNPDLTEGTD